MKVIIIDDNVFSYIINFNNVSLIEYSYDRLLIYSISNTPTPNYISTTGSNITKHDDCIYTSNSSDIKCFNSPDIDFTFKRSIEEEYKRIKDFLKNKDETVLELNIDIKHVSTFER